MGKIAQHRTPSCTGSGKFGGGIPETKHPPIKDYRIQTFQIRLPEWVHRGRDRR